ncbi:MAG: alpha/beta fold hydrolase [Magnetovibrio sp.]|nr:alpha/beta fold hydrolase [Magnetovibrio sp.]
MSERSEKITFPGALGENLAARLDLPAGAPKAYALFAHCFTCTKDIFAASRIAAGLTEHGIAVVRFDFTGLGASDGEFANTNFSSNVGDLVAAADYMRANLEAPAIVIGHSLGGAAVLAAAGKVPEAKAICTVGAPADPAHLAHHFQDSREEIEAKGEAEVQLVGRPFRIQKQFLDDIASQKLEAEIAAMQKALLVFHSPVDQTVGVENAQAIYMAAKHPKSFVSLDDADHLLSKRADAVYVADVIAAWAARYIDAGAAEAAAGPSAEPGTVVVQETGAGKFANAVSVGGVHALKADEPVTYGGTDTGPTPYDYLLTALGACKAMTMRMYAERKGIKLERATVTLRHDKIHADDCAECETETGKVDDIQIEIGIEGDLDDATRQRIAEIADMCPVHKTLHSEVRIESRLSD